MDRMTAALETAAKLAAMTPAAAPIFERMLQEVEDAIAKDPIARARAVLARRG